MTNWMAALAAHHRAMRQKYPQDELMILFDIDGTILDLRHMMLYLLQRYDRDHGAEHFRNLALTEIDVHENSMDQFLMRLGLDEAARTQIEAWYLERYWSSETIAASHYAFDQVLDVIRWFQIQPRTTVGLNTGRFERLRADTLLSLNRLGDAHGVHFTDELLYTRPDDWTEGVSTRKVMGIRQVQAQGYRVIAFIDNEPGNLAAIAQSDVADEMLLLHADTIFLSPLDVLPTTAIQGDQYALTDLITEEQLPAGLDLVWHGVNDPINLRHFSPVRWGRTDVNLIHRAALDFATRHLCRATGGAGRDVVDPEALAACQQWGKAVKLDFKVGGAWLEQALTSPGAL
ncbi:MAG: hypothetical protein R3E79_13850 [Caldilineaceae bacterium]